MLRFSALAATRSVSPDFRGEAGGTGSSAGIARAPAYTTPVRRLLALCRIVTMAAMTIVLYALYLARPARRAALTRRWHARMAGILGLRATIEGAPPAGAFLLVSNHLSYVDVLLLGSVLEAVFVAKADIRGWPLLGALASSTGTIFIDRASRRDTFRVAGAIERALAKGRAVVVFPEGTSTDGTSVLPFKSSLLDVAARHTLPVHYATIRYATAEAAWGDDEPFTTHAWRLLQQPRIEATLRFGPAPVVSTDRKLLARELWEGVRAGL
ncbi:MAG: 1-acyl-sn-glycerol-3-phosphate acyltransferase [Acidobacteria bacterium]|nr:1-acyl-sn-glycerol-3-phosphate acyltransferase [Acidobacteriota bacterium]